MAIRKLTPVQEGEIIKGINFGQPKSFEKVTESLLFPIVKRWTELNIDAARELLTKENHSASHQTAQELKPNYKFTGDNVDVTLMAPKHAPYLDKGVSGVVNKRSSEFSFKTIKPNRRMAMSVKDWVTARGYTLPQGIPTYDSFAYAISTNIKKRGIERTGFISDTFSDESVNELAKAVTKALGISFSATFKYLTRGSNNSI